MPALFSLFILFLLALSFIVPWTWGVLLWFMVIFLGGAMLQALTGCKDDD